MAGDLTEGATFTNPYPFVREIGAAVDEDGPCEFLTWKPGLRAIMPTSQYDDGEELADAMGKQILTVVSIHRPGRFPPRVFFTRQWETPDGKLFGKAKCRVTTQQAFRRMSAGFRSDIEWRMATEDEAARYRTKLEKQMEERRNVFA